jgi:threonine/homoserine/homoserine lactone efflux protein
VPSPSTFAVFALAALALLVVPGPAVLYIVTQSVSHGRTAGFASVLGIQAGSLVHVTAATLGLSALLASSAEAFDAVKYAGAAYLISLGVRRLLRRDTAELEQGTAERRLGRLFRRGVVVNVLNPKTALFFLAFLPQFVDRRHGSASLQILVLGLCFSTLGLLSDGTYALLAGTAAARLRDSRRFAFVQRYVSGSVFLGLGLLAAVGGGRPSSA